jgi:hypothetical protein
MEFLHNPIYFFRYFRSIICFAAFFTDVCRNIFYGKYFIFNPYNEFSFSFDKLAFAKTTAIRYDSKYPILQSPYSYAPVPCPSNAWQPHGSP